MADSLSPGVDPRSESARAIEVLTDKFGQSGQTLIVVTVPRAPTAHLPARSD